MPSSFLLFASSCTHNFLGLEPWYKYLALKSNCDINYFHIFHTDGHASDVPLILAAIIDDLLRIAGLVALGFVIVGAINFITSEGNPDNAASARSTVINALAGLAICITAAIFVNFIGTKLGG